MTTKIPYKDIIIVTLCIIFVLISSIIISTLICIVNSYLYILI